MRRLGNMALARLRRGLSTGATTWRRLDRAVLYASLGNAASLVMGPVTVLLVTARLTPELQGFYYTFGSLSLFSFFAEFGLGQAVMQFASHEWPRLSMTSRGAIQGEAEAHGRVTALTRGALLWCAYLLVLLLLALILAGEFLFRTKGYEIHWRPQWLLLVACFGVNFLLVPVWALLQGFHRIEAFWFYRLIQQILNALTLWGCLFFGARLWAPGFAGLVGLVWSISFLRRSYPDFLPSITSARRESLTNTIAWRRDVWPMQWRTAISWMGAYFTGQALVPITFRALGPAAAGRMGMTVTLAGVLGALSLNFINTKSPVFGSLVSNSDFGKLDLLFLRLLRTTILVMLAGAFAGLLGVEALQLGHFEIARRLLDPVSFAMYLGFTATSGVVTALATYLRAFKREPFALLYALTSGAILFTASRLATRFGLRGMAAAALLISGLVQLPIAILMFARLRRLWTRRPMTLLSPSQGSST